MAYRLLAMPSWGSAITEAMLAVCGVDYVIEDMTGFTEPGAARDRLLALNPLAQLPTLVMPDGSVMTESGAITLLLAELHPDAGLAPEPGDPRRAAFLRWLIWLVANVYPSFTYSDFPERFVDAEAEMLARTSGELRERLWRQIEGATAPNGTVLGRFSALDIYVAVMTHWRPRRPWFEANCPRLMSVARACEAHPLVGPVLARNFAGGRGA